MMVAIKKRLLFLFFPFFTVCRKCDNVHMECPHLIIVGGKLVEELLDSELLSRTVHVGDLLLRQAGEIQLDLTNGGRG